MVFPQSFDRHHSKQTNYDKIEIWKKGWGTQNMSFYLNSDNSKFSEYKSSAIFVDKSMLIQECNDVFGSESSYICVTRPRRFGKTLAISMLNAYYSKGCDSREMFKDLKISKDPGFEEHLNKHNVIWIDMAELYANSSDKTQFVKKLKNIILRDLKENYTNVDFTDLELWEAFIQIKSKTKEKFIFLIDEWDVIYREQENNNVLCEEYTDFLRGLFKSSGVSSCIDLVYMTGILPIRRYTTQSTLNMFKEYNMLDARELTEFVGFTEEEVKGLCAQYHRDFNEIKNWYDGYHLRGIEIYNPKSVVEAVLTGECADYWTQTSATEAVSTYMNYDHGALKDLFAKMILGEKSYVNPGKFNNDLTEVDSQDAALTVLIHLGYLAYDEESESCYIPNYEIKEEFVTALDKLHWKEIYNPINNSMKLYKETLNGNADFINETLDKNHADLASQFNKNKEDVLGMIVHISYYSMTQWYDFHKESTSLKGRSDIAILPKDNTHIPFIVELKVDSTPEDAISQIKEKEYFSSLGSYKGKVLLLGISYDSKTMRYSSKVEYITL